VEPFNATNINVTNGRAQGMGIWNVLSPFPKGLHVVQACTTLDLTDKIPGVIQFCVTYYLTVLGHLGLLIFPTQRAMVSNSTGHAGFGGSVLLICLIICKQVTAYAYLLIYFTFNCAASSIDNQYYSA
jgi:hypothetical protein